MKNTTKLLAFLKTSMPVCVMCLSLLMPNEVTKAQGNNLTIENIMKGEDWMGASPDMGWWSIDSKELYFDWNPENALADSLYVYNLEEGKVRKLSWEEEQKRPPETLVYNSDKSQAAYIRNGDLYLYDLANKTHRQITSTIESERRIRFSADDKKIIYTQDNNVYTWEIATGKISQLSNFKSGKDKSDSEATEQEKWIAKEEMELIGFFKRDKEEDKQREKAREKNKLKRPKAFRYGSKSISRVLLSPSEAYITFQLSKTSSDAKETTIYNYVTESGFAEEVPSRIMVGRPLPKYELGIYHLEKDTVYFANASDLPGIKDVPDFMKKDEEAKERAVYISMPKWSKDGKNALVVVQSMDNKDRWIALLDCERGTLKSLDHQRDKAWIGGPGISAWRSFVGNDWGWLDDDEHVWFQSEQSGWSHLYTVNVRTGKKKQLTKGDYEVFDPQISEDGEYWYFSSSEVDLGERHFYKMPLKGGKAEQLTSMKGNNQVVLSPDEKWLMIRHSYSNRPWELFVQENKAGAEAIPVTDSFTDAFKAYQWREPKLIDIPTRDGKSVRARLYRSPKAQKNGPAVVFAHGAGYLQNVHHWWSSYYREYMFHNFLVDNGYTVLDIDFRGSAGYGSEWRTDVYRALGDKDLTDHLDAAQYLVDNYEVSSKKIGIYGGSYGGFITLMALFKSPETFACGAALRSVTDWAHYNHLYTANRLNVPYLDSVAYRQSSPIYFAEGLEKPLLICHGMLDSNVHFQDVVRLAQRLIELGKEDWEMAVYPLERHSFQEAESWTDEYKRIFKLFEENLK